AQTEKEWAISNFIQMKRLNEVHHLVEDLTRRLKREGIEPSFSREAKLADADQYLLLQIVIAGAFFPNYFLKDDTDEIQSVKELGGRDPHRTVIVSGLPDRQGFLYNEELVNLFRRVSPNPVVEFEGFK